MAFLGVGVEQVGYRIVDGEKSLQVAGRFKFLPPPFSLPGQLVRILRPIVQVLVRSGFDAGHELPFRRCV
jgi:hypothetical protein